MLNKQEKIGQYFTGKKEVYKAFKELRAAEIYAEMYPYNDLGRIRLERANKAFEEAIGAHWCNVTKAQVDSVRDGIERILALRSKATRLKKDKAFRKGMQKLVQGEPMNEKQIRVLEEGLGKWGFTSVAEAERFLHKTGLNTL